MKQPRFTISVLAMNGVDMTRRCIESVLASSSRDYELLLTNNGSEDGTAAYFDSLAGKKVRVIHNATNLGFSAPNNHALTLARGKYFVTLNNDATVPPDWLDKLEAPFLEHEKAGQSGPEGSCCTFPAKTFHGVPGKVYEYVEASCMCIPVELARRIGLFSPYLVHSYCEDADLSLRVRARGYTIHQVPFQIEHHRSQTARAVPGIREIAERNHQALFRRWSNYLRTRKLNMPIIVRRMGAIGDVLLTTPVIRALHEQHPQSEVFVETAFPAIFRDNPAVKAAGKSFAQHYGYAQLIDLDMAYENQPNTHIVQAYCNAASVATDDWRTEIFPNMEESEWALSAVNGYNPCAIHVGPTLWPGKTWPIERFRELSRCLISAGYEVILVGNEGESMPHYADLRGKTTLHQLAALLEKVTFFIGVDSFPMNCALAVGCPTIGIFGATSARYIIAGNTPHIAVEADPAIPCAGGRHRVAGQTSVPCSPACIESVTVDRVIAAVRELTK